MGLFDFFKTKKAENFFGQEIRIPLSNPSKAVLAGCKKGNYVNLWAKAEMDKVYIYAPNTVGGSGQIGTIPSKYFRVIKTHILNKKDFGISGPSTNNYEATIVDITPSSCIISIRLYSSEEYEARICEMVNSQKKAIKIELEKKYRMSKPVDIKFTLKGADLPDLEKVQVKIFDKEYYIEHPHDYKIQLVGDNNMVIGETFSQKDKVFRVVKAHLNGQSLEIKKIVQLKNQLKVTLG